ncbi:hypothetical protein G4B88_000740 [Cannabis sativa]|uniref:Uncharacterized protein n=1 Tax=Cannabis sativa TaxID=3483 RepID=A0A7J6I299_CANSA|nr:hypothetical protein G4B88_000740 [Cannabis sativa]
MNSSTSTISKGTPKSCWFDDQDEAVLLSCEATLTEGLPRCVLGALIKSKHGHIFSASAVSQTKKMMKDIANDIGFMPIQMVLEKDSLLMKAVELHHSASAAHTIDC